MRILRRGFLAGSAATAFGLATTRLARAAEPPAPRPEGVLRLSSQIGIIPGKDDRAKIENLEKWGYEGVELGGDIVGNEKKWLDVLKNSKVKVSAICWGSAGGALVSENPERRAQGAEQLKRVIASAGELKSTGVIFVPAFNGETKLTNQEIRKILVDTLPAIGDHAVACGTRVILEPLNRNEAFFLRLLADAAAICRDAKSPGVAMMGDFYHMGIEETSDLGAFISAGSYLHHVHLATTRSRIIPGQEERSYVEGFRGLKMIGYQDYCSLECGVRGEREVEIPKSAAFLRNQWTQA
jgi:sugar phosphate isomerase/epimerase